MRDILSIWSQFALCLVIIGLAGVRLSRYGDAIASLTGLSRNWIGLILVATVTSLPELVTGLSAVTVATSPNMAVGDVLGSCVFNLLILALIDLLYRQAPMYAKVSQGHIMTAGFGVILLAAVALALTLSKLEAMPSIGHISLASLGILALYMLAMRAIYLTEQRNPPSEAPGERPAMSLKAALMGYSVASAAIVAAGIWLPLIGLELARLMGWTDSFVGTLFVAFATSVPELATTWGAVRIGALDMAMGNLLGSNLFDTVILAIDDVAYEAGDLFASVSSVHTVSALTACVMSGAVIVALAYRPVSRIWRTASWASLALMALYLMNARIQYLSPH